VHHCIHHEDTSHNLVVLHEALHVAVFLQIETLIDAACATIAWFLREDDGSDPRDRVKRLGRSTNAKFDVCAQRTKMDFECLLQAKVRPLDRRMMRVDGCYQGT
jgi:hypothetical protein